MMPSYLCGDISSSVSSSRSDVAAPEDKFSPRTASYWNAEESQGKTVTVEVVCPLSSRLGLLPGHAGYESIVSHTPNDVSLPNSELSFSCSPAGLGDVTGVNAVAITSDPIGGLQPHSTPAGPVQSLNEIAVSSIAVGGSFLDESTQSHEKHTNTKEKKQPPPQSTDASEQPHQLGTHCSDLGWMHSYRSGYGSKPMASDQYAKQGFAMHSDASTKGLLHDLVKAEVEEVKMNSKLKLSSADLPCAGSDVKSQAVAIPKSKPVTGTRPGDEGRGPHVDVCGRVEPHPSGYPRQEYAEVSESVETATTSNELAPEKSLSIVSQRLTGQTDKTVGVSELAEPWSAEAKYSVEDHYVSRGGGTVSGFANRCIFDSF